LAGGRLYLAGQVLLILRPRTAESQPPFTCDSGGKRVQQSLASSGLDFCREDLAGSLFFSTF
jgi:hypothetical protein